MDVSGGHTVLQVPVPALEPFVRARHAFYDQEWVSPDPGHVHAHVTALGPFVPEPTDADLARVAEVVATTAPFDFVLARVATFPDGLIHLVPEPAGPFAELTRRLWAAFPGCPPYAGEFPGSVPHLTLDRVAAGDGDAVSEASTRALLGSLVPARCRAERLDLAWYAAGDLRTLRSWPLGG